MAQALSGHNPRIARVQTLREKKGRREHGVFAFEGATLLEEARSAGTDIREIYATQRAYDAIALLRTYDTENIPVHIVDERTFAKISDVESPSGVLAVAPTRFAALEQLLALPGLVLGLADLNDPGNVGTLLRSAEAFGTTGVILGDLGADPYHPKVVRGAMGALFRLPVAVAAPAEAADAAASAGADVLGLDASGRAISQVQPVERALLLVGHERRGLGRWASICTETVAIPMPGRAESLNAAVAGSVALYELLKRG